MYELVGELSMNSSLTPTCRCGKRLSGFTTKWSLKLDCAPVISRTEGPTSDPSNSIARSIRGWGRGPPLIINVNPRHAAESVARVPHLLRYAIWIANEEGSEFATLRVKSGAGRGRPTALTADAREGGGVGRPQYFGRQCDVFFAVVLADTLDIDANSIG